MLLLDLNFGVAARNNCTAVKLGCKWYWAQMRLFHQFSIKP